jgi:hypothetical protein
MCGLHIQAGKLKFGERLKHGSCIFAICGCFEGNFGGGLF